MKTLLIDSNAMCHRVKYTLGELNYETEKVGVIFGVFMQIMKLSKQFQTKEFVFCWDSTSSHRQKVFPEYKEKRRTLKDTKTPQEIEEDKLANAQFDQLRTSILPAIGFPVYMEKGFEADDLLASITKNNSGDFIIATSDEDIYQLLAPNVSILKQSGLYHEKDFRTEYGIEPNMWSEVKAIAGCTSDNVPGIAGVGETRAISYILGASTPSQKSHQKIICSEGKTIIGRNRKLVRLPYEGCPVIKLEAAPRLSLYKFIEICQNLNFQYFLRKDVLNQWKELLGLT